MAEPTTDQRAETFIETMRRSNAVSSAFRNMLTAQARLQNPNAPEVWVHGALAMSVDGPPGNRQVHIRTGSYLGGGGAEIRAIADLVRQRGGTAHEETIPLSGPLSRTPTYAYAVHMTLDDFGRIIPDLERHFHQQAPPTPPQNTSPPSLNDPESCALWSRLQIKMPGCGP